MSKYCVKVNEKNKEELRKWVESKEDCNGRDKFGQNISVFYVTSDRYYDGTYQFWSNEAPSEYKEISFEKFKQTVMQKKEIIGYKTPFDLYDGKIKAGHKSIKNPKLPDYHPETI